MKWLLILGFAVSSSIDNLGVGVSYGMRNIRIGLLSNLWVSIICFLFSITGISFGQWVAAILPGLLPVLLASFLLFVIGIRIILLATPRNKPSFDRREKDKTRISVEGILKKPESADLDQSGEIGLGEASILGIALSANALTNGISAGLLGLSAFAISLTAAIGSFLTVWLGVAMGRKVATLRIGSFSLGQFSTLISGAIIVLIAIKALFD
ncbi:sporulation membrane protein YtaF [Kroppenstedtia pulmonis]|uniref:Sporulation membrane protein YtaF n=1 Tax=Kroppenstedtia pulmonis TaxID=1380685 RepID=A0A7D4BWN8_9BACL|nr:sporulation membrane protein YtaF [Kroppenstedtia pulmonis]QKG85033.1 sporulation membrane protein YtaF [Kroppenstedtia pulmonis]